MIWLLSDEQQAKQTTVYNKKSLQLIQHKDITNLAATFHYLRIRFREWHPKKHLRTDNSIERYTNTTTMEWNQWMDLTNNTVSSHNQQHTGGIQWSLRFQEKTSHRNRSQFDTRNRSLKSVCIWSTFNTTNNVVCTWLSGCLSTRAVGGLMQHTETVLKINNSRHETTHKTNESQQLECAVTILKHAMLYNMVKHMMNMKHCNNKYTYETIVEGGRDSKPASKITQPTTYRRHSVKS